ncbi:hypothetical protein PRNP1_014241 [Phytophthora ramorum]
MENSMDSRTTRQRAEDKCVYWGAQVQWWERWAQEHDLGLDAASSASVHLSFLQELATQAAQEQQAAKEPATKKKTSSTSKQQ